MKEAFTTESFDIGNEHGVSIGRDEVFGKLASIETTAAVLRKAIAESHEVVARNNASLEGLRERTREMHDVLQTHPHAHEASALLKKELERNRVEIQTITDELRAAIDSIAERQADLLALSETEAQFRESLEVESSTLS